MNHTFSLPGDLWAIVLAGGEGTRMGALTRRWLGYPRPKQYCTFFGEKSLLAYTLERMSRLVGDERTITVVGKGHRRFIRDEPPMPGHCLEQPAGRGTGPGVLLPASYIYARNPEAIVVISPSDHFISPEEAFFETVLRAVEILRCPNHQMILLGARPDRPEPEYGWIRPGSEPACSVNHPWRGCRMIKEFVEKPESRRAVQCFACGYVWNTMIIVAKVKALWSLGHALQKKTMACFERLAEDFTTRRPPLDRKKTRSSLLEEEYSRMAAFDFSRDFLSHCAQDCLMLPMDGITWSDLGRPSRVIEILKRVGYRPNFPVEMAEETGYQF